MSPRGREFERLSKGSKFILISSVAFAAACQPDPRPTPTAGVEVFPTQTQTTELIIEPTEIPIVSPPVWSPPTLEQARVVNGGGEIPDILNGYTDTIRIGFSQSLIPISERIDFRSTGIGDDYRFAFIARNPSGNLLWAKIQSGGIERYSDYPLHFNLVDMVDESGNEFQRLVLDTQNVSYGTVPESESADIVWGGSDGTLPIVVKDSLTLLDGSRVYSQYWDISTSEWKQIPQLEAELAETVAQEILPTTCLDPDAQAKVEADFLEQEGFKTMVEAMEALEKKEDFNPITEWYGFDTIHRPYWSHALWTQVLGALPISLAEQPGFRDGDKALCLLVASPYAPEGNIPIVIGVQKDGQWGQISYLLYQARVSGILTSTGEEKEISSLETGEEWINEEMRGRVIKPNIQIRFFEPDNVNWYGHGGDFARPLVQNPNSYTWRYTQNPTYLVEELGAQQLYYPSKFGQPNDFNIKVGDPFGEQLLIHRLLRDLNRNPGGDIGLFGLIITLYK